ncbi:MarR family transcriptional regulator [Mesorhizobium sp. RMAD-H1]|uniref:MarR family winged helix-turn-helix transcriptional regulator n=1 Tax=Mesorhizobium sp. RMAD-H1 TaxID=2587065 RepID=UPI001621BB5D|nr:MarR family transcriptional regulator [Mesorhizobium sp. RMAD-H1]MBB2970935.1 DNA-binding MarR family transcriptional regulator [Mesorhizobium sp. RMAD-H1]
MNKKQDAPKPFPWDNPRFKNWVAMMRAERAVGRELSRALAPLDLKVAQLDAMINLYRHPGQSQHDLARRLLVGRSNITMLLPQLEAQGLLRREGDPKDKRVMRLYLTGEGEKKLMQALEVYTALIDRVMSQSTPEECDMMGDIMRRITEMLKED